MTNALRMKAKFIRLAVVTISRSVASYLYAGLTDEGVCQDERKSRRAQRQAPALQWSVLQGFTFCDESPVRLAE
jgi:hypothetical protein